MNKPGDQLIVLTSPVAIERARLLTIETALNLQVRTGLKHSHNAPPLAARAILAQAGLPAARTVKKLAQQFADYRAKRDRELELTQN